jgi:AcrR family transcriptional regulator
MPDATATREKLLDAAARLFAERGVDNVSIAEIVREAGQRNASAVQYHFGNRNEVLRAVLARHVPEIAALRLELLDLARAAPAEDVRSVAEAIVRPVTEFARLGWRERAYLQVGFELTGALERTTKEIRELMEHTAGPAAWDLLRERCAGVPDDLWVERQTICINFVGRAAAERARRLERGERPALTDERFVENLVEMVIAAMTAPYVTRKGGSARAVRG